MSLLIRARVSAAAMHIVPSWPLDSFIAVNPLGGSESHPFDSLEVSGIATTRPHAAYLTDFERGRIRGEDLEAALRERSPEVGGVVNLSGSVTTAVKLATLDMQFGSTESPFAPVQDTQPHQVDNIVARWLAAYLSPDAEWPMPNRGKGFYRAWRTLAKHDVSMGRAARRALRELPERAETALAQALSALGVAEPDIEEVLRSELQQLPGWTGYIKWRAEKVGDIDLTSYLAVRLTVTHAIGASVLSPGLGAPTTTHGSADVWQRAERVTTQCLGRTGSREDVAVVARVLAAHPAKEHLATWQRAYEINYRDRLLRSLGTGTSPAVGPTVQVVMCIDPRSEVVRRHLELSPEVETLGFAGFFGVPVRFAQYQAREGINSLPALLTPRHSMTERPVNAGAAERRLSGLRRRDAIGRALHAAEENVGTSFAFAELAGWFSAPVSALRTFAPAAFERMRRSIADLSAPPIDTTVTVADAFSLVERATLAETAVRMMGMREFAPLVILTGHGSTSTNNLYQSALDCGACGGNPGAANARAAAAIFNDTEVRDILEVRGIEIPPGTFFVAAEHNSTSDTISLLDTHLLPESHTGLADQFVRDQGAAADLSLRERAVDLPGASARQSSHRLRRRSLDWAEVYPELGLVGNAAMVIGSRELTRGVALNRRVFLHSYLPELDPDGSALETIMTAPVVVAQWINHQYFFSTLNPEELGAGTKTIHNAIGTLGVLSGHRGDLRRGLPWQSIGVGDTAIHEALRLAVIVEAPLDRVGLIVSRNQVLRDLFDNQWITLTARENSAGTWHHYTRYGWKATPVTTTRGAA